MVVYNYSGKEINAKIVYYGPALSGKTTNLEWIYSKIPVEYSGKMVSLRTQADRTIFFDFLPLDLGMIDGFRTRFMLYTVPGQVHYNATRKMVLKGVDGLVFVADSEPGRMAENVESLQNLRDNLQELGMNPDALPLVMQWNKRDLPNSLPVSGLETRLNPRGLPSFEACALTGEGVYETLHKASRLIYTKLTGAQAPVEGDHEVSLFGDSIAQCLQDVDVPQPKPEAVAIGADDAPIRSAASADDPFGAILGRQSGDGNSSSSTPRDQRTRPVTPVTPESPPASATPPATRPDFEAPPATGSTPPPPVFETPAAPSAEASSDGADDPPHQLSRPIPALSKPSQPVTSIDAEQLGGLVDEVLSSLDERDDIAAIDRSASRPIAPSESHATARDERPLADRLDSFFDGVEVSAAMPPVAPDPPAPDASADGDEDGDADTGFAVEHDADVFEGLQRESGPTAHVGPDESDDDPSAASSPNDLELITDPRRLPNSDSITSVPSTSLPLQSGGVIEIPITLRADQLEGDQPLRIVLKVDVAR